MGATLTHTETPNTRPASVSSPAVGDDMGSWILMVTDKVPGHGEPDPDAIVPGVLGDPVGKALAVCCDAREAGAWYQM